MTTAKPRTLAIDDDPANLLLEAALGTDFDLQIATSGAEGLALASEIEPDLILLDVMMPGVLALVLCAKIPKALRAAWSSACRARLRAENTLFNVCKAGERDPAISVARTAIYRITISFKLGCVD